MGDLWRSLGRHRCRWPFVRIRTMLRAGPGTVKRRGRPIEAQSESSIGQNPGMPARLRPRAACTFVHKQYPRIGLSAWFATQTSEEIEGHDADHDPADGEWQD